MEEGEWKNTEMGTPQGSVVTPRTQKITSNLNVACDSGVTGETGADATSKALSVGEIAGEVAREK